MASNNAARKKRSPERVEAPAPAPASGPKERGRPGPVEFDQLIHDRVRLGIVSALAINNESVSFSELKAILGTSDGNLSVHARRLEDAGYIDCSKSFEGRVPRTEYSLTTAGRRALRRYLEHMEALIQRVREG